MIRLILIILLFNRFDLRSVQSVTANEDNSTQNPDSDIIDTETEESGELLTTEQQNTETDGNPEEPEPDPTSSPVPSPVHKLVIVIIVALSLLVLLTLFLCYWFCIKRKAPREEASTEIDNEDRPPSPEKKGNQAETKSLSSEELDLSVRSEVEDSSKEDSKV